MIAIIDYGAGNLKSVTNALDFLNVKYKIITNPDDVKKFIEDLKDYGIIYLKNGKSHDLVVVDQIYGFASDCDWAEFGTIDWDGDPNKEISACRIKESRIDQVITPEGWEYENSLSKNYKFVRSSEKNEKVVFLRHEDGLDVYIDLETGKEVFIGRSDS